jgi:hypothetical protein
MEKGSHPGIRLIKTPDTANEPDEKAVIDYLKMRIKTAKDKRDFLAEGILRYQKRQTHHIRPVGPRDAEDIFYSSPDTQKQVKEKDELIEVLKESLRAIQAGNKGLLKTFWEDLEKMEQEAIPKDQKKF